MPSLLLSIEVSVGSFLYVAYYFYFFFFLVLACHKPTVYDVYVASNGFQGFHQQYITGVSNFSHITYYLLSLYPTGKVLIIGGSIANFTNVAATFKVKNINNQL